VVNMLSVLAHVNLPLMASYSASKAAAMSFTQAFRAEASGSGVRVCGVYPSLVDTAMSARAPGPKLLPQELAAQLIDAIRVGFEDLYPGAAEPLRAAVQRDWKAAERQMAQRLAAATGRPV
jgi:short-subunit dehydrogenase